MASFTAEVLQRLRTVFWRLLRSLQFGIISILGFAQIQARPPSTERSCPDTSTYCLDSAGDITLILYGLSEKLAGVLNSDEIDHTTLGEIAESLELEQENSLDGDSSAEQNVPLRVIASAKHLSFGSAYVGRLLYVETMESEELKEHGHLELEFNDSSIAFLYLLFMLHGRNDLIPRFIPFHTLVSFAMLVQYHDCYSVVSLFAEIWLTRLSFMLQAVEMADMLKVAYIGMVFGHKDLFANATRALINNSASFITADGLPMPHTILDKVNEARDTHLKALIKRLLTLHSIGLRCIADDNLRGFCSWWTRQMNSHECSFRVTMTYAEELKVLGIIRPRPSTPFGGLFIQRILSRCENMVSEPLRELSADGAHDRCALQFRLRPVLSSVVMPEGLDLDAEEFSGVVGKTCF